jgi:hypothetical protein
MKRKISLLSLIIILLFPAKMFAESGNLENTLTRRHIILTGKKNKGIELTTISAFIDENVLTVSFNNASSPGVIVNILVVNEAGEVIYDQSHTIAEAEDVLIFIDGNTSEECYVKIYSKDMELQGNF